MNDLVSADTNVNEEKEERRKREAEAIQKKGAEPLKDGNIIVHGFNKTRYEVPDFKEVM